MPERLIAAEMQPDATIPNAITELANEVYEKSLTDPKIAEQLEQAAALSMAKVVGPQARKS